MSTGSAVLVALLIPSVLGILRANTHKSYILLDVIELLFFGRPQDLLVSGFSLLRSTWPYHRSCASWIFLDISVLPISSWKVSTSSFSWRSCFPVVDQHSVPYSATRRATVLYIFIFGGIVKSIPTKDARCFVPF